MKNLGQLSYNQSLERGMVVDGSTQCAVWTRALNVCGVNVVSNTLEGLKKMIPTNVNSNNAMVILLEPPFVPSVISEGVDKILFREMGVGRVVKVLGGCMAALRYLQDGSTVTTSATGAVGSDGMQMDSEKWINDNTKCCCVVDSGHSFTHVIPTQSGAAVVSTFLKWSQLIGCISSHLITCLCLLCRRMLLNDLILVEKFSQIYSRRL